MKNLYLPKRHYLIKDCTKDFHSTEGMVRAADLQKPSGSEVTTSSGTKGIVVDANFMDLWRNITRKAQIMVPKDLGWIIQAASIDKSKVVVDAGTGSGGAACFFAHYAKYVYSYDWKADHVHLGRKNAKFLQLNNVEFEEHDITTGVPKSEVDLVMLDISEPWLVVESVEKSLNVGGYFVTYSPSVTQAQKVVIGVKNQTKLRHLATTEVTQRDWQVDEKVCRPGYNNITHTGFLNLFQRISLEVGNIPQS